MKNVTVVTDLQISYNYKCKCPECKNTATLYEEDFAHYEGLGMNGCLVRCPKCQKTFFVNRGE